MKRAGNLLNQIANLANLYHAFWKAGKGKRHKEEYLNYQNNLDINILTLRKQILAGKVHVGDYHFFKIYDPKERKICAAHFSERVLHHAIMNICHDVFEKKQIFDSYASRKDKGTYAAIDRAKFYTRKYKYYLKLDFRKYFASLNHDVLKSQLVCLFKDDKLLDIYFQIIDSYSDTPATGVPIGNLTSQYFANHYLSLADHFAKEKLKSRAYVRYMDDVVLWANDKDELLGTGNHFKDWCERILILKLKPFCLNYSSFGLPFLSYRIFPGKILLSQKSKKRFKNKWVSYNEILSSGVWNQKEYQNHIRPLFAFVEKANSYGFRKKLLQKYEIEIQ